MYRKTFVLASFISLLNFWIWHIFQESIVLAVILIVATLLSFFYLLSFRKLGLLILLPLIITISVYQWNLTTKTQLINLTPPQQHAQNARVVSYPISEIEIGNHIFHYPLGNLLDGRKETIALYKVEQNFFEALDLNYYFFATHPRERVDIPKFEKFPFIYFPFFISGLILIKYKQVKLFLFLTLFLPLILISFIGSNSSLGIFVFFPFVCSTILLSIYRLLTHVTYVSFLRSVS